MTARQQCHDRQMHSFLFALDNGLNGALQLLQAFGGSGNQRDSGYLQRIGTLWGKPSVLPN